MDRLLLQDAPLVLTEPRWVRKQREQASSATSPSAPANGSTNAAATPTGPATASVTTPETADRFIPQAKSSAQLEISHHALVAGLKENLANGSSAAAPDCPSPSKAAFRQVLAAEALGTASGTRILSFSSKAPVRPATLSDSMRVLYSGGNGLSRRGGSGAAQRVPATRYIPQSAERVLDAPSLVDDFYLNLLDWSPCCNVLAVALGQSVYLWSAETGDIHELLTLPGEPAGDANIVTSLRWMRGTAAGANLAVGTAMGDVQIWDCVKSRQLRNMRGHTARVGALSWMGHMVASGSRDSVVMLHDVRRQQHLVAALQGHVQEVCGLEWSPSGTQLASGGNDNVLNIWDASATTGSAPRFSLMQHSAAVKALAWCPWQQNLLASGGGTADRCIKFWNSETGACVNSIDTHSQVTSLQWSTTHRELVSAHGFSNNQLTVWRYPSMEKVCDLVGHEKRILHTARSPDGSIVVSAGADETLRFWSIWPAPTASAASSSLKAGAVSKAEASFSFPQIR